MFRWGILGAGSVAGKFVVGLRQAEGAAAVVVASRTTENAERFAHAFGIERVAPDYDSAIAGGGVDAFYISSPAVTHAALAVKCLESGIPALVEKPLAASLSDAEAIREAANVSGAFCMEAMWTRFLPAVSALRRLLNTGDLGRVRGFSGGFCTASKVDPRASIYRADLGGGALLHRGVYPLSLASHFLGEPMEVQGMAIVGDLGVDEDAVVLARHPESAISVSRASLRTSGLNECWVTGEEGVARLHGPIYRPFRLSIAQLRPQDSVAGVPAPGAGAWRESPVPQMINQLRDRYTEGPLNRAFKSRTLPYHGNGYQYEADEVRDAVLSGRLESSVMPLDESVAIVACMERVRSGPEWLG